MGHICNKFVELQPSSFQTLIELVAKILETTEIQSWFICLFIP